jgi:flagellar biosynthesis/type III secretory pathway chaperone
MTADASSVVPDPAATAARLASLLNLCAELTQLLDMEFDALKAQELDRFEHIQSAKTRLLTDLTQGCPSANEMQNLPEWAPLQETLSACRDLHRRNAVLIERKLDVIRTALHSLSSAGHASSVEVYDRLGHVSRFNRAKGYHEA